MTEALDTLLLQLDLEQLDADLYRGQNPANRRPRMFGGHVASQALIAAARTVTTAPPHSLHAYFLRAGQPGVPVLYRVERTRDGRSFSTRSVIAEQEGEAILQLSASFHAVETGFEHAEPMGEVPAPDECTPWETWLGPMADRMPPEMREERLRDRPIELRFVEPVDILKPQPAGTRQRIWCRAAGSLPDDPLLHRAILAYASDHALLSVVMRPHGRTFMSPGLMAASLDHALWFHREPRMDEWLLYEQVTPAAFGGRGLALGRFYTQAGVLVASVAQEGLVRDRAHAARP
ncbi:MAG TPA: acyl-CoA thioesterase II [Polyangiales bacterium]|nr:acyl-CoA thioesterase II [Polyangiales bacterium]